MYLIYAGLCFYFLDECPVSHLRFSSPLTKLAVRTPLTYHLEQPAKYSGFWSYYFSFPFTEGMCAYIVGNDG